MMYVIIGELNTMPGATSYVTNNKKCTYLTWAAGVAMYRISECFYLFIP